MHPRPEERDFYDPDVPTDANPSRLREVILAQAWEPGGAVVALFTSATLDGGTTAGSGSTELVDVTTRELDLDEAPLDLFTPDAYLLQSALGERLLPGDA